MRYYGVKFRLFLNEYDYVWDKIVCVKLPVSSETITFWYVFPSISLRVK